MAVVEMWWAWFGVKRRVTDQSISDTGVRTGGEEERERRHLRGGLAPPNDQVEAHGRSQRLSGVDGRWMDGWMRNERPPN